MKYSYTKQFALSDIKRLAEQAEQNGGIVVWATHTCWWYISPSDIAPLPYKLPTRHGLPCDPRGSVLLQSEKPTDFIKCAEENLEHYGKHGIEAFVAAFHGNVVIEKDGRQLPTSFESWEKYNEVIDETERAK